MVDTIRQHQHAAVQSDRTLTSLTNIRKILAHLRAILALMMAALLTALGRTQPRQGAPASA
jgi:hypothetical protein